MNNFKELLEYIDEVRNKEYVGIPFNLGGFDEIFPYIEPSRQILVYAATGIGKTQFAIKKFLIDPFLFARQTGYKLHITYFAVEMRKVDIMGQVLSYLYNKKYGEKHAKEFFIRDKPDDEIMTKLADLEAEYSAFNEMVDIVDTYKNPTGIYKHVKDKCLTEGRIVRDDEYSSHYENTNGVHQMFIVDTINSMRVESGHTKTTNIDLFSGVYSKELVDKFGCTGILIQQADKSTESNILYRGQRVEYATLPARGALAYSKHTPDDANVVMNLYSPFAYNIPQYPFEGRPQEVYNIREWKNNFRRLAIEKNRDGDAPAECGMYFDGKIADFQHLPSAEVFSRTPNLIYNYIERP